MPLNLASSPDVKGLSEFFDRVDVIGRRRVSHDLKLTGSNYTHALRRKNKKLLKFVCCYCEKVFTEDSYSIFFGEYFCNYPCFVEYLLNLRKNYATKSSLGALEELVTRLEMYNSYFVETASRQIKVINDENGCIFYGNINVHWVYRTPIAIEGLKKKFATLMFNIPNDNIKYVNVKKLAENPSVTLKEDYKEEFATVLSVPIDHTTLINTTSSENTNTLLLNILKKHSIINEVSSFSLYLVSQNINQRRLFQTEFPLRILLNTSPVESECKICLMSSQEKSISKEAAQYISLPDNVLKSFIKDIDEQENKQISLIKQLYDEYAQALIKSINDQRKLGQLLNDMSNINLDS